jgi:hypothetical protein
VVKGESNDKGHFMDSSRPCKLKSDEEKSKYANLAQQKSFWPNIFAHSKVHLNIIL